MPALITWWTEDLGALAPDAEPARVAQDGADLLRRWSEPHRRYHGTRHLVEVFWALEELGLEPRAEALGRVAGWFHDAVYDVVAAPGANEAASAELAEVVLPGLGLGPQDIDVVVGLVQMTAAHEESPDPVSAAFHDADLWILSADAPRYAQYRRQVREEYASVPDDLFRQGRAAIMSDFARRDRIYSTPYAHREWEPAARANLARELAELAAPDSSAIR